MTQVSSDLEIVAVRASMEADFEGDPVGRDAMTLFNQHRDTTPAGLAVEFVTASGRTEALVTLTALDVRPVVENDLVAVRPFLRSA